MHTKIHKLFDSMKAGRCAMRVPDGFFSNRLQPVEFAKGQEPLILSLASELTKKPLFLFDVDLHEEMSTADMVASLKAMKEAGCLSLPFPEIVVETRELNSSGKPRRNISLIREQGDSFNVITWLYNEETDTSMIPPSGIVASLDLDRGMVDFTVHSTPWVPEFLKKDIGMLENLIKSTYLIYAGRHITAALILLNTKGMAKRVVPVEPKLNKKRARLGRVPIPSYTYINIGTVYDRSGNAIDRTTDEGKRASPRVHLRRAHNRNVRVGKGRTGFRLMHFPAVLVNFDPRTGEAPQQKRYKVKGVSHNESSVLDGNVSADPVVTAGVGGGQLQGADGVL